MVKEVSFCVQIDCQTGERQGAKKDVTIDWQSDALDGIQFSLYRLVSIGWLIQSR